MSEEVTTLEARHGLIVRIRDASTGEPAARGAEVTACDGDYAEDLRPWDDLVVSGAVERPGVYEVVVTKPGYATWQQAGVVVERNGPHVAATVLDVSLEPKRE